MKIEGLNTAQGIEGDDIFTPDIAPSDNNTSFNLNIDTQLPDVKSKFSEATGLIQTIVTSKLTDDVIRKMPSDEYLQLLSLLDEMITGSINKEV